MKQMYKVFLNDRVIKICSRENITIKQPSITFGRNSTVEEIGKWFHSFEAGDADEAYLVQENPEEFFKKFQAAFKIIHAAGGVVTSGNRLLFIFRKGKWDLPKGKMEKSESAQEGALREVEEETGIAPDGIDCRLPSTFHIYKSPYPGSQGEWIFKETFWFQMKYSGKRSGVPQKEEGITQVKWVEKNGLQEILSNTYENLKQIISVYLD